MALHAHEFNSVQLAGQRLMVGFEGREANADLVFLIQSLRVGGIVLFSRNIGSPEQLRGLCSASQELARACGQPSLFVAVDQEGGSVARLRKPFTEFPGNPAIQSEADALKFARITATELKSVGINMNLAPVLDVAPREIDSVMAQRSFGADPRQVARLGGCVIDGLQANGVLAVAKHFPGIGRTTLDSHLERPLLNEGLAALRQADLLPFADGIRRGVCGVMLAHILYPRLDADWPASLSSKIAGDLLRKRMGFKGLALTDDLEMGAIARHYDMPTVADRILAADIDLGLVCRQRALVEQTFERLHNRIEQSRDIRSAAVASAARILRVKRQRLTAAAGSAGP
jgi:beta-N-acetylhexosaminidase